MCLTQTQLEEIERINLFMIQILLDPKDTATLSPLLFISIRIKNNGLVEYDEMDILLETYTRAIDKIRKNEDYEIDNISAWFKGTANHIISDICKYRDKSRKMSKQIEINHDTQNKTDLEIDPKIERIIKAFKNLSSEDREILDLRIVKSLSWSDIAAKFISEERKNKEGYLLENNEEYRACLRQRFLRAKKKLREKYEDLENNN